ncbi:hypothetical protein QW180_05030 [Vibrio sinaloensis]|nr:hypothetical protein [Vibrio sinaloensis]
MLGVTRTKHAVQKGKQGGEDNEHRSQHQTDNSQHFLSLLCPNIKLKPL